MAVFGKIINKNDESCCSDNYDKMTNLHYHEKFTGLKIPGSDSNFIEGSFDMIFSWERYEVEKKYEPLKLTYHQKDPRLKL